MDKVIDNLVYLQNLTIDIDYAVHDYCNHHRKLLEVVNDMKTAVMDDYDGDIIDRDLCDIAYSILDMVSDNI